jgi:hypothetical protein
MPTTGQYAKIERCILLHESPSQTLRMLDEVYGKVAKNKTQVYERHKRFRDVRANVNNDASSGRHLTNYENMRVCTMQ